MRRISSLALCGLLAIVAGCGGGGDAAPSSIATSGNAVATSNAIAAPAENVQPVSVEPGPAIVNVVNLPFVSVTVCAPGSTANCQTIDHVVVDTASYGLRIVASELDPAVAQALVQQSDASSNPIVECTPFASGSSWGPVKTADVTLAGLKASSVPIQVIGDAAFMPSMPAECGNTGVTHNTVQTLLANGILGVGFFRHDCGSACANSTTQKVYYACSAGGCQPITVPLEKQVQNPVSFFASDNNGVILQLPVIPASGATNVAGALVFGIGTRANNGLGNAKVFTVNANGRFTTVYRGRTMSRSFVDSGSNGYFFSDTAIPRCGTSAFYCPNGTLNLSATIEGRNGAVASVDFSVANTNTLLANNPSGTAFNNLAGTIAAFDSFDWGLPFFFGRSVYTAFSGASTPWGAGPYIAF